MFQDKKTVALNFSDYSIEALELTRERDALIIRKESRILLESGILEDGKIIDQPKLKDAIQKLLAQAKPEPIVAHDIVITLPESRVFEQVVTIPSNTPRKQIANLLFSKAAEIMPIDATLMAADFRQVRTNGDSTDYLFVATYRALLDEYIEFFQGMQLKVSLVTMESLALTAAIIDERAEETVLIVDIGARTTIATIVSKGEVQESININIAGAAITAALAEKLKISVAEAEQRKISSGLTSANGTGDGSEMLIIQGQIQPLKDELLVFIKFYERKTGTTIHHVLLAGGSAALVGLDEYFSSNLGLPVSVALPSPLFQVAQDQVYMPTFLVALGLARIALGDRVSSINFLSHREHEWAPSTKGISIAHGASLPAPGAAAPRRSRRMLILAIVLLVMVNVVGWLLWINYGPASQRPASQVQESPSAVSAVSNALTKTLGVVIRPFTGSSKEALTSLSFSFTIGFTSPTTTPGVIVAKRHEIAMNKPVSYDESSIDYVRQQLKAASTNRTEPSDDEVQTALQSYLADRLWDDAFQINQTEIAATGGMVLESFITKTIKTAKTLPSTDAQGVSQMQIDVVFTAAVLTDSAAFNTIEKDALRPFFNAHPGFEVWKKSYSFASSTADPVKVTALYTFKQTQ